MQNPATIPAGTMPAASEAAAPLAPRAAAPINRGEKNMNPPGIGFWALLAEDRKTHDNIWEQGFWAIAVHRLGNWRMGLPRIVRPPFTIIYRWLYKWVEWTCGITLPYTVIVGRRVRLWHHSGMILHAARIGDDVHIRQNTTFGIARKDRQHELPTIEEGVDLGCGVVVLGSVTIGRRSMIGANAVVLKDIPPDSVAVGVPAKVIKTLTHE